LRAALTRPQAGALSASGQTASTALDRLRVGAGDTLLVHAAAGGVGSFAVQVARAGGARVIGTASERNHDYLRELGATAVCYGDGLVERVRAEVPGGIGAALVAVGSEEALHARLRSCRIVRGSARSRFSRLPTSSDRRITTERSAARLGELTRMCAAGSLRVSIQQRYRLDEAASAHRAMETGHVRGKLVFVL